MEWVSNNIVTIVSVSAGWLATLLVVTWRFSKLVSISESNGEKIMALTKKIGEHEEKLDDHCTDSSVHTTFEQRQAINSRFDRLEGTVKDGHTSIEAKIDRLTDRLLLSRQGT